MKHNVDIDIRQLAQSWLPCMNQPLDFRHGKDLGEWRKGGKTCQRTLP
jgi:hypothetical protein